MKDEDIEWYKINDQRTELEFKGGKVIRTTFNHRSRLFYIFLFKQVNIAMEFIEKSNHNFIPTQQEGLRYNWRLGQGNEWVLTLCKI